MCRFLLQHGANPNHRDWPLGKAIEAGQAAAVRCLLGGGASLDGASAVEYGLLVALIAVVIWLSVSNVGKALNNMFTTIASNLNGAGS